MKYFKIYHKNCTVSKAYWEITKDDFDIEAGDYAAWNTPDFEDEDGNIEYDSADAAMSEIVERIEEEAASVDGFDVGDYNLYIRDDDADMYDIAR